MKNKTERIFIGFKVEMDESLTACSSNTTQYQVNQIMKFPLKIEIDGSKMRWSDLYDTSNDRAILNYIINDRKIRVDKHIPMADRPPLAIITFLDHKVVRVEYYEGHDLLKLQYDLYSNGLDKKISLSYKEYEDK